MRAPSEVRRRLIVTLLLVLFVLPATSLAQASPSLDEESDDPALVQSLLEVVRRARSHLAQNADTVVYRGDRELRVLVYSANLYARADAWIDTYRKAVRGLLRLPVARYLARPDLFVDVKEALRWGRQNAIAEPQLYKVGFLRGRRVL